MKLRHRRCHERTYQLIHRTPESISFNDIFRTSFDTIGERPATVLDGMKETAVGALTWNNLMGLNDHDAFGSYSTCCKTAMDRQQFNDRFLFLDFIDFNKLEKNNMLSSFRFNER
jgi:hypothetical protein